MKRRPFFHRIVVAVLLGLVGCASPTIPLPPPEIPDGMSFNASTNEWTISGSCSKGALVTVFNEETGLGSVVEDRNHDGRYEVKLEAKECDVAWISQHLGLQTSAPNVFVILGKENGSPTTPGVCK